MSVFNEETGKYEFSEPELRVLIQEIYNYSYGEIDALLGDKYNNDYARCMATIQATYASNKEKWDAFLKESLVRKI